MTKRFFSLVTVVLGALCASAQAINYMVPADAKEIIDVLGPDARGLRLLPDALPDLFTLTASRLEEDPKLFIVEQPYTTGRWAGGKAIIEYARDLSYTQVSIYDKAGRRQRIYSVRSRLENRNSESSAKLKEIVKASEKEEARTSRETKESREASEPQVMDEPVIEPPVEEPAVEAPPAKKVASPVEHPPPAKTQVKTTKKSKATSTPASAPTPAVSPALLAAATESAPEPQVPRYEWSEEQGAYVQVGGAPAAETAEPEKPLVIPSATTSSKKSSAKKTARTVVQDTAKAAPVPDENPVTKSVEKKAVAPREKTAEAPVVVAAVPAKPAPAPTPVVLHPTPVVTESWGLPDVVHEKGSEKSRRAARRSAERDAATASSAAPAPAAVATQPPVTVTLPPPPPPVESKPMEANVPSVEELLGNPAPESKPVAAAKKSESKTGASRATESPKPEKQSPTVVETPVAAKGHAKNTSPATTPVPVVENQVVLASNEAYDLPAEESRPPQKSKSAAKGASHHNTVEIAKAKTEPKVEAKAEPKAEPKADKAFEMATARVKETTAPGERTPTAAPPSKPMTSDSDSWVPQATVTTPEEEPVVAQAPKVAMAPKPAPPDASIDSLLAIAAKNEKAVPGEGDAWVPTATSKPAPDADIRDAIKRARSVKKAAPPVVKINRDINNPEEGVLPVNSFEKFSGGMYGRHREYERRLSIEKRPKALLSPKEYDFLVDEVDRKKEYHNVYFYRHEGKGKPPKLVAVEKHEKVYFLGNYDVEKEDKGKLTRY